MLFLHEDLHVSVETLNDEIRARYPRTVPHKCRCHRVTYNMFAHAGKFASLRGSAKECAHVVEPLLSFFEDAMDRTNHVHRQIRLGMRLLLRFAEIVDRDKDFDAYRLKQ